MKLSLLLTTLTLILLSACRSVEPIPPEEINELYRSVIDQRDSQYLIKPSDSIQLRFFNPPSEDLEQSFFVLPDGRADPFFMDNAIVAGKTLRQLEDDIRRHYSREVPNPEIVLQITSGGEKVYVEGHVGGAATQVLSRKMTLSQLLANAGGYRITASADSVLLVRPYWNPERPDRFRIDLYNDSEEVYLLPNDHVIVEPTTWILLRDYFIEYVVGIISPVGIITRIGRSNDGTGGSGVGQVGAF